MKAAWSLLVLALFGVTGGQGQEALVGRPVSRGTVVREPIEALPRPRVAVMSFENRSGAYYEVSHQGTVIQVATPGSPVGPALPRQVVSDVIGEGMSAELEHALQQTGAFELVDLETIRLLGETVGELGVDFFVKGTITSFMRGEFSTAGAIGRNLPRRFSRPAAIDPTVGPGNIFASMFADQALGLGVDKAHLSMVVQITRGSGARRGTFVGDGIRVEASPTDLQAALAGEFGRTLADWGVQYQTPVGEAIRACLIKAADRIATHTWDEWRREWARRERQSAVEQPGEAPSPEETPAAPSKAAAQPTKVIVKAENAVVRERPDANSPQIATFRKGTEFEKLDVSTQWTKVKFGPLEGWVITADLEPVPIREPEMVIIRERPEPDSPELARVRKGTPLERRGALGDWINVKLGSLEGWVLAADLGVTAPTQESPTEPGQ